MEHLILNEIKLAKEKDEERREYEIEVKIVVETSPNRSERNEWRDY